MGRANVYLPDDLERRVKAAQIPISEVCQRALLAAVEAAEGLHHPFSGGVAVQFQRGWESGVRWTQAATSEAMLTVLRDQRLDIPTEMLPHDLYTLSQEQTLAWEAGFVEAARSLVRMPAPSASVGPGDEPEATTSNAPNAGEDAASEQPAAEPIELGDDSGSQIGVTLDGSPVCFDPHAAVRTGKSPLFAILGSADPRARLALSIAQDAASRGTGVVLIDLSGELSSRAKGLGRKVRVVRQSATALPKLDDLVQGAVGLGGLWQTFGSLSRSTGMGDLFGGSGTQRIEPGYVTIVRLSGDGQLGAGLAAMQLLSQFASKADFPRLLQVDLPAGMSIPSAVGSVLGRVVRVAREQNAAVGLSAESADTVAQIAGNGALLSTALAFATSSPVEADALRRLLGTDAPILLNPPGTAVTSSDDTWAVMRDLSGRLGQVRMEGW